jgi:hypothetical protein
VKEGICHEYSQENFQDVQGNGATEKEHGSFSGSSGSVVTTCGTAFLHSISKFANTVHPDFESRNVVRMNRHTGGRIKYFVSG